MNQKSKKNYEKRGNPYLREKAWVYIYYEPLPNGKKKQRYAGGFETKEAALLAMRARTPSLPVQIPPLKELLIEWFETVYRISVEPNTWNVYSIVLYRYILPYVEDDIAETEPPALPIPAACFVLVAFGVFANFSALGAFRVSAPCRPYPLLGACRRARLSFPGSYLPGPGPSCSFLSCAGFSASWAGVAVSAAVISGGVVSPPASKGCSS